MLNEFSVKNFMSFRDKVTLSIEKGNGDENPFNVFEIGDNKILKTCAIYGANASGKSNLLKALNCAISMVRQSNVISVESNWKCLKPFLFDDTSLNNPTEFEFIILIDNIKYRYSFSAKDNKIISEHLDAYYSQKPTMIFSRNNSNEYKFNIQDETFLKSLVSKNTDNKLFLSTSSNWNYNKTKEVYLWFLNSIETYETFDSITKEDINDIINNKSNIKEFTLDLLKESDILINDFSLESSISDTNSIIEDNPIKTQDYCKLSSLHIKTYHEILSGNGKKIYPLNMEDESSGTKILFTLAPFLKKAFTSPKVIIVDELEKSLHPSLVSYLIKIFNSPKINISNSQLIFTTHAVNLLNLDLFRRDQIYFVERNPENGSSDLYPLDAFSVRKDENIQKGYINGRYGAIPLISDNKIW